MTEPSEAARGAVETLLKLSIDPAMYAERPGIAYGFMVNAIVGIGQELVLALDRLEQQQAEQALIARSSLERMIIAIQRLEVRPQKS